MKFKYISKKKLLITLMIIALSAIVISGITLAVGKIRSDNAETDKLIRELRDKSLTQTKDESSSIKKNSSKNVAPSSSPVSSSTSSPATTSADPDPRLDTQREMLRCIEVDAKYVQIYQALDASLPYPSHDLPQEDYDAAINARTAKVRAAYYKYTSSVSAQGCKPISGMAP